MVIIGNFLLALILAFAHIVKATFFGRLREVEVERLVERGKDAIMETCLALTIFREEFNARTLALFACLGCAKAFHWLAQDRTEHLQTAPAASRLAHLRMTVFMALLTSIDAFVLAFGAQQIISRGPSVLILIVFEFLVLLVSNLTAASKYGLTLVSAASEGRMDPIGPYMFYVELVSDLINFILYATFFVLVCMHYGLPLHLVRDLYASYRTFRSRIEDFIRYRRATSQLNERFPEPTEEELSNSDRTCIICREEMSSAPASNNARPKTLPCGHMFHLSCLRSWFERQQSCPTCRTSLLPPRQGEQRGDQHQAGGEERHEPAAQEVFRNDHHAADNRQFRRRVVIQRCESVFLSSILPFTPFLYRHPSNTTQKGKKKKEKKKNKQKKKEGEPNVDSTYHRTTARRQGQAQGQEQVPGAQQVRYLLSNKRLRIDRQRPFATNGFFALNARDPRDQVAPENRRRVHFVPLVVPANNAREAPGAAAGSGASSRSKHEVGLPLSRRPIT